MTMTTATTEIESAHTHFIKTINMRVPKEVYRQQRSSTETGQPENRTTNLPETRWSAWIDMHKSQEYANTIQHGLNERDLTVNPVGKFRLDLNLKSSMMIFREVSRTPV